MVGSKITDELSAAALPAAQIALDADLARRLLGAAPTILYVYDVQNERSVFQNRRFGDFLGYAPSASRSSDWTTFIHPDDSNKFPEHRERLKNIRPGETLSWEFRMRDAKNVWRWFQSRDSLLSSDTKLVPLLVIGSASEITEQKEAEQHKELLADEMRHRARNLVAIVQAIGRMSRPKNQPEANKFIDVFMGRLLTLLNTGGIVLSSASRMADLKQIAIMTLAPFGSDAVPSRISTNGPMVTLSERVAGGLALAFHELATNAVKYGALSVEEGSVSLTWTLDARNGRDYLRIEWKEAGGPPALQPETEGFGGMVIRQSVAREPDGKIDFHYAPEGFRCVFDFRISSEPN